MTAAVRTRYGSPEVLELKQIPKPELTDDGVLVRVRASSVNRGDWYMLRGKPLLARPMMGGLRKPKETMVGTDFAGTVEAVGASVTDFHPGDEVFGGRSGAFAEYVCARSFAAKPANVTFEEAAAVPVAALTALQALRDKGEMQPGWKVLINGASGGVGTYAVQIAKALGGEVTAVCSTRNVDMVRSLGADRVVDYTKEDFTKTDTRYDLLIDVAGSRSWSDTRSVLKPKAKVIVVGAPEGTGILGPLGHIARFLVASKFTSQKAVFFVAKFNKPDMAVLQELMQEGKLKSVVERRYELSELGDALRYMGEGHAQGKIVITL